MKRVRGLVRSQILQITDHRLDCMGCDRED